MMSEEELREVRRALEEVDGILLPFIPKLEQETRKRVKYGVQLLHEYAEKLHRGEVSVKSDRG